MLAQFNTSLLTESETASRLAIQPATLRRWRWSGDGPRFVKVGFAVRYDCADIEDFVNRNRRDSTTANQVPVKAA